MGRNIIFIGRDGKVVIASATGELKVVSSIDLLPGDVTKFLKKRQAVGKELLKALAEAKYPVVMDGPGQDLDVIDPSGALAKFRKKKKRSS